MNQAPSKHVRYAKRCALIALGLLVLWLGSSFAVAWKLTGRPASPMPESPPPDTLGPLIYQLRLSTSDGETLSAWFLPGRNDRAAIVLMHGNRGTRRSVVDVAQVLHDAGHAVLMPTMRAHGDSTGTKNDLGYSSRHDAIAAVEELERRCPNQPIVLFGQSLGAAAAMFAAESLGNRVAGYILECPYESLFTATRNRTRAYLPPGVELIAYAGLRVVAPIVLPDVDRINVLEAAGRVPAELPVLILAGGQDSRATPAEAKRIAERLGPRARMEIIAKGSHLGLCGCDPENYAQLVLDFLDSIRQH